MDVQPQPMKAQNPRLQGVLAACGSGDPRQATAAINVLGEETDPALEPFLRGLFARWRHDPSVLEVLLDVYDFFAVFEAADEVLPFLRVPHAGVVVAAASVLESIDDARLSERALEEYLWVLRNRDAETATGVLHSLARLHRWRGANPVSCEQVIGVLTGLLEHPARPVRVEAVDRLLWSLDPHPLVDGLLPCLRESSDPAVLGIVLTRMVLRGDQAALDRTVEVLRGPDPEEEFVAKVGRVGAWSESRKVKRVLRKELERLWKRGWADREPMQRTRTLKRARQNFKPDRSAWLGMF